MRNITRLIAMLTLLIFTVTMTGCAATGSNTIPAGGVTDSTHHHADNRRINDTVPETSDASVSKTVILVVVGVVAVAGILVVALAGPVAHSIGQNIGGSVA